MLASFAGCAVRRACSVPSRSADGARRPTCSTSRPSPQPPRSRRRPRGAEAGLARSLCAGPPVPSPGSCPHPRRTGLPPPETAPGIDPRRPRADGDAAARSGAGRGLIRRPGAVRASPSARSIAPGPAVSPLPEVPEVTPRRPGHGRVAEPRPSPSPERRRRRSRLRAAYPIDLPTALRLADDQNPEIAEARVAIIAASAQQLAAYSILLPSLNAGLELSRPRRQPPALVGRDPQRLAAGSSCRRRASRTIAAESISIPGVNLFGRPHRRDLQAARDPPDGHRHAIQRRGDGQRGAARGLAALPRIARRPGRAPGVAAVGERRPTRSRGSSSTTSLDRPGPQGRRRPRRHRAAALPGRDPSRPRRTWPWPRRGCRRG